uniref:gamma conglutin 1-like n=1 Tax=Erigeron canadensis TaxID=72917 RepID=UPI001CB92130|nr:gamma conglutin 1-like [Erigeron canadensis]
MFSLTQIFVIVLAFNTYYQHDQVVAQGPSAVAPITKHINTAKPLFSVQITSTDFMENESSDSNFLIDIDAPLVFHDCSENWKPYPVPCDEYQCEDVQATYSSKSSQCRPLSKNPILPGWGYCGCPVNVINPVTGSCDRGQLNYDYFLLTASDQGRNPTTSIYHSNPTGLCAPSASFQSYPKDVTGVMTLSSSPYALPADLSSYNMFKKITALCLPSNSSAPGVFLYGAGPYYLLPNSSADIRSYLAYTPLLKRPGSFGYFISVSSIVIKKRSIDIPANATAKLTTTEPYTTLRTDIYNPLVRRFSMVTKRLQPAKPVAPFSLCFSAASTANNTTKSGLKVPDIELNLQGGKKWAISTANSMKQVTKDVACLAFVDGGATSDPAIVIGTFQFEDNFVVFDLENSTFGFSSSLLSKKTSCSNFNFTNSDYPY